MVYGWQEIHKRKWNSNCWSVIAIKTIDRDWNFLDVLNCSDLKRNISNLTVDYNLLIEI